MTKQRWQDWMNLVLGGWLLATPWMFEYTPETLAPAAWNAYAVGAGVVLFAAFAIYMPKAWASWLTMAFGLWLVASPWVLGFTGHMPAVLNAVVVGLLVLFFEASALSLDRDIDKWWHDHVMS